MGIDAEMFAVVTKKPTDEELLRLSFDLCKSIGAHHFFLESGLPPAEYKAKSAAWHTAFREHPSYPLLQTAENRRNGFSHNAHYEDAVKYREQIYADIGAFTFKMHRQALYLTGSLYPPEAEEYPEITAKYLEPGKMWVQDGDRMLAADDEWFVEVSIRGRYYGVGYERGDILTYCAIAEWLEVNMPNIKAVYYGGDSSGVLAELFDNEARTASRKHLYSASGRDYFNHFGGGKPSPIPCSLCIPGENRCSQYGTGANYEARSCAGCGKNFATRDGGKTWEVVKDE